MLKEVGASVYLLPTHSENFGLTVAEALAHGLPVLTTDGTPWHELATKDSGFCVPWSEYGKWLKSSFLDNAPRWEHQKTGILPPSWEKLCLAHRGATEIHQAS